ncbi:MAG: hypothetical protein I3274_06855, partial [Candidatus Moeniiplasma glomeromycotorum]|nr:hypothetical protein [Candidatus Moeniiplasma glomeromycotorum]
MTEIKIQFEKIKVERDSDPELPTNVKVLRLEISPINVGDNLKEFYEKMPPAATLKAIFIGFYDGAENEIYNELLDDKKTSFELSWEKEKVSFFVVEKEEKPKNDNTKPMIDFLPINKGMQIQIKPQFAGIIKITPFGKQQDDNDKDQNDNKDNKNDKQKIDELEAKIKELEKKLQKQDNSEDQKKVKELKKNKTELEINSL